MKRLVISFLILLTFLSSCSQSNNVKHLFLDELIEKSIYSEGVALGDSEEKMLEILGEEKRNRDNDETFVYTFSGYHGGVRIVDGLVHSIEFTSFSLPSEIQNFNYPEFLDYLDVNKIKFKEYIYTIEGIKEGSANFGQSIKNNYIVIQSNGYYFWLYINKSELNNSLNILGINVRNEKKLNGTSYAKVVNIEEVK